ncbi:uncharacterized protein CELE_Y105C5B.1413 [Caenorhabditis elegans]|uniref:Uncharacterized protein n=1 Tax=Caenorhabditis elegans TaxID=6239 RepID=D3DEL6_CAEEL|nr:Uncharacterized protein CELE_Y105C5B.1413 [Caenorhabditis elegans]CBJ25104.1 Uncharacterized protein CELE_Y105C5B.1413 [Caenorhabditis elegans]|eukprot:NP_001255884.1 Uncharacterized protein CELE_Y105C5B.1413 [Caenorhabditis elegans]
MHCNKENVYLAGEPNRNNQNHFTTLRETLFARHNSQGPFLISSISNFAPGKFVESVGINSKNFKNHSFTSRTSNGRGSKKRAVPYEKSKKERKNGKKDEKKNEGKSEHYIFDDEDVDKVLQLIKEEPVKEKVPETPEMEAWITKKIETINGLEA